MNSSVKLGRIWGIPVNLNISWFLIFALVTLSLGTGYFPSEYPQFSPLTSVILGLVTSLLFFGSVLAHELGHSFIALRNQIPVKGITLFIFGGVAQITREPHTPGAEFRIAIAGPVVSLGLAFLFGCLWLLGSSIPVLTAPSMYLMRINFILALFNLIPGFPLDGGRVLRALVWTLTKNFRRATRVATVIGQFVAFGFIGLGTFNVFTGQLWNGMWLVFIGWFLQSAAANAYSQATIQEALRGLTVGQAMSRDCIEVPSLMPLSHLIQERVLSGGQHCFFVAENGQVRGMLTLRDITRIPQSKWGFTTAGQLMVPYERLVQVQPDTALLTALQTMDNARVTQIPVVQDEQLVGSLSREQVLYFLRLRAQPSG